ncbi:MAG: DUF1801 domain-containing protein [Aquiluna sp.]|nr:DUF1801 domain-containing protein [Aquiluna sp.]MCF8546162.1 DUF1801 domain-containing protein [Aquiluna sp.]
MVSSRAATVEQYLSELDPKRAKDVTMLRELCLANLPGELEEVMEWGMISYQVPFELVPETYNGKPLLFAAFAAQKNYISLYLMGIYGFDEARERFEKRWIESGKKLNIGKACIRFKSVEDIPLEVIRGALSEISVQDFVAMYEDVRGSHRKKRSGS